MYCLKSVVQSKVRPNRRKSKNAWNQKMHENINLMMQQVTKRTVQEAAVLRTRKANGKMIFEKDKVPEGWAEYIGDLFADNRPTLTTPSNDRGPQY